MYLACFSVYDQIVGLIVGAVTWLRNLMVGEGAPLRVIQDSIQLLGYVSFINFQNLLAHKTSIAKYIYIYNQVTAEVVCRDGTIPCITLILGGNLTQGEYNSDHPAQHLNQHRSNWLSLCLKLYRLTLIKSETVNHPWSGVRSIRSTSCNWYWGC